MQHTHTRSQTHSMTSSPLPKSGCPLPHTHNPPCSLGRCPHAGRAGPSRGPPPAHSGCPCGLLGTRSSGNCPCPRTAHLSDTALPAAPLRRGEQGQSYICSVLPASLTASPNTPAGISHQGLTHTPLGCQPSKLARSQTPSHKHISTPLLSTLAQSHTATSSLLRCHPSCLMVTEASTILALASCPTLHIHKNSATHPIPPIRSAIALLGSR